MSSVLQHWVTGLPFRHQGVLLAGIRGYDGLGWNAKPIVRCVRFHVLYAADEREVGMDNAFMAKHFTKDELRQFLNGWDHHSLHFITHLMHAVQVLGYHYKGDYDDVRDMFFNAYLAMVRKLHLFPESQAEMDDRLTTDRIAKYGAANAPAVD